ncbi:GNAT family N-acetyltransferase [Nocardioides sp. AX2bis]|uniref:GNAT family N-acetyltransferase n=1 Tax=Nocardioides sp. AX2bis TaxID=2653157 RepID=UPI0012F1E3F2|nr:GNAT family N-acetyltransferase [Nocardioides sp. AX2bis]VXC07309.1 Uncharacterized N-acetyltransferase NOCAX2_v1_400220 [Nocardioides sp. AX2bis]
MDQHLDLPTDLTAERFGPDDLTDDAGALLPRVRGFGEAVGRAFLEGRGSDERHRRWVEHLVADRAVLRGVWEADPALGPGTATAAIPVATFTSFDKTLAVGDGRVLDLHMITDVTVSPAHRRRGLTRRLMTADLADAAARGLPLAALTVSEGSIYGRFGFGCATTLHQVDVDTGPRFALRADVASGLGDDPGRFAVVEPLDAWPAVQQVFAAHHAATRGSVERPQFYEPMLSGAFHHGENGPDRTLRAVVHLDATGAPDGYALYRPLGKVDGVHALEVTDLIAPEPTVRLRLWRFLAEMDLVRLLRFPRMRVDDALAWALVEPRAVRTAGSSDMLWVRVLDVVAALEARPWYADGDVVLEVEDPLDHASGRWRLAVEDGVARVTRTDDPAGVRMTADTLGALYLGGVEVATLHAAGRLPGVAEAVRCLAALADGGPAPYCSTGF